MAKDIVSYGNSNGHDCHPDAERSEAEGSRPPVMSETNGFLALSQSIYEGG